MKRFTLLISILVLASAMSATSVAAAEPDYSGWNSLLTRYYDPGRGMNYGGLKKSDLAALNRVRSDFAKVNVASLNRKEQLAFWLNLYNVSTVGLIVDHYPLKSIRDLSSDPVIRLNVFKKDIISLGNRKISLNDVENDHIRAVYKDPRIHFAINCAAKSCPPMRTEAFTGARVDAQLDDQVRRFVAGNGARIERKGDKAVLHTSMITKWFKEDFAGAGGVVKFLHHYLPPQKAAQLAGTKVTVEHDDYDWSLNDRR